MLSVSLLLRCISIVVWQRHELMWTYTNTMWMGVDGALGFCGDGNNWKLQRWECRLISVSISLYTLSLVLFYKYNAS